MKTTILTFIKLIALFVCSAWTAPALAEEQEQIQNPVKTEIGIGIPILFLTNSTAQGSSTTLSLFGFFIDAAFCPIARLCGTLTTHANVDIKSGRRVWEGPDIGAKYFIIGKTVQFSRPSEILKAEQESLFRLYHGFSLSQRDYDFRTVVESQDTVFVGNRSTLEGSFWNVGINLGADYLVFDKYRIGATVHFQKSISGSTTDINSNHIYLDLKLLNIALK